MADKDFFGLNNDFIDDSLGNYKWLLPVPAALHEGYKYFFGDDDDDDEKEAEEKANDQVFNLIPDNPNAVQGDGGFVPGMGFINASSVGNAKSEDQYDEFGNAIPTSRYNQYR